MKKCNLFLVKTLMVLSLVFVAGCSKDDDVAPPDPEGTITVTMSNSGSGFVAGVSVGPALGFGDLRMMGNNNFCGDWASWHHTEGLSTIANVGKVLGLGSITRIPNGGFISTVAIEKGHGYVVQVNDGTYARLYVVDWVVNKYNEIIGAKVKYQYPWAP